MALVALLYANHRSNRAHDEPDAAIEVTGISSVHRQIRQCRRAGAARVIVMVERMTPRLAGSLERARREDGAVEIAHGAKGIPALVSDDDDVLSLDEGLVADERAIAAVAGAAPGSAVALWRDEEERPIEAERIAADSFFAGIARFQGGLVRTVADHLGDWDMQSTLLRAALGEGDFIRVEVGRIPLYDQGRRREVPLQWTRVDDEISASEATDKALAAAQKGVLDWPARYVHAPIENALTRLAMPTPLTPNLISVAAFLVGLVAMAAFAEGWFWLGLILALVVGPLDGVDGKLARSRVEFSKWGDLEHVADKIVEYGWLLAMAWYFAATDRPGAWGIGAIAILFALAEAVQGEFYRRFTGRQLDDAGTFERRFRLVAGRRNTFFWSLIPFGLASAWYQGFIMIAAYSAVTFFITQARFFVRLRQYGIESSERIAANFSETAYGFLPDREPSAS